MSIINLNKGDNLSATLQNGRIGAPVDARQSVLYYKDIFDSTKYKYPYAYCQVIVRENDPEDTEHPKGIYVITELDRLGDVVSSGVIPLSLLIDGKLEDITIATTKTQSSVELGRINSEDSTFRIEAGSGIKVDKWSVDPEANAAQISADTDVLATKTDLTAKYEKPSGGIPKTDLSSDVQASLNKADTALQNHQDISGKADKATTYTKTETDVLLNAKANTADVEAALATKQDTITDLTTIRSGAARGATAQQPATTLAGYGITDGYTKTEGQTLETQVTNAIDSVQDAVNQLNGNEVVVVTNHATVANPDGQKIYREQGSNSYIDWMYQDSSWKQIATYTMPGFDSTPTKNSSKIVESGGVFKAIQDDAVFDVSAHNLDLNQNPTPYESLALALADIPTDYRKGGMSIKFIKQDVTVSYRVVNGTSQGASLDAVTVNNQFTLADSSSYSANNILAVIENATDKAAVETAISSLSNNGDSMVIQYDLDGTTYATWTITKNVNTKNEYVQYRFLGATTDGFTTIANWQGVDSKPVIGSRSLVEGNGVFEKIFNISTSIPTWEPIAGKYIDKRGILSDNDAMILYDDILLESGMSLLVYTHTPINPISIISKKVNGSYIALSLTTGHVDEDFYYVYTNNTFVNEVISLSILSASQNMTIVRTSDNIVGTELFNKIMDEYCRCYILEDTPVLKGIKDKVAISNIAITNGYYINSDGTKLVNAEEGYMSKEVLLRKGMQISVKCYLDTRACLMSYYVNGTYVPLIVPESTTGNSTELITIPYDGKYVFSSFHRLSIDYVASANIDKQITDITYRDFVLETGNYITSDGVLASNAAGRISEQIPLLKGEKIKIKGFGRSVVCAISQYIDEKNIPLVNYDGSSNSWQELEYVSDNNIIVRITSLINYPLIVIETQAKEQLLTTRKELVSLQKSFNDNTNQQYTDNILAMYDNITCLGDSLTYSQVYTGTNISRQARKPWGEIIGNICGNTVEIIATPGYNATTWWNHYSDRLVAKENNIYFVYLCNNGKLTDTIDTDCPPDVSMEDWANTNTGNLCRILQTIYNLGDKAILIKRREWDPDHVEPNIVLDKFGVRFNFPVLDNTYFSEACYHTANGNVNSAHYNDLGYCMFANYIIKKTGKLSETMLSRLIS